MTQKKKTSQALTTDDKPNGAAAAGEPKACTLHGEVGITYKCEECPLCSLLSKQAAHSFASLRVGRAIVNLTLLGIPVRFQIPQDPAVEAIGALAMAEISSALKELGQAIGLRPSLVAVPGVPPIVIPR